MKRKGKNVGEWKSVPFLGNLIDKYGNILTTFQTQTAFNLSNLEIHEF